MSTTTEPEVIDGTVVEAPRQPNTEIVRSRRREVLRPLDTSELLESFHAYQDLAAKLLDDSDYQIFTQTERDPETKQARRVQKRFKKKSAWRKLGAAFDLDVEIVSREIERDHRGSIVRASVVARAITAAGRHVDADGYCSRDERGFSKPEHDIPATATTRAKNRAISDLLGTGEVSAEEADGEAEGGEVVSDSPYGKPASEKELSDAAGAASLIDIAIKPEEFFPFFCSQLGVEEVPAAAARMVAALWWAIKKAHTETESPPQPAEEQ